MRLLILVLSAILLAGCTHMQPAHTAGCAFVAYPLQVSDTRAPNPTDFESVLARAMILPPEKKNIPGQQRPSVLILSGGSQHGAFGAGFFAGMPSVPDYKMVTAISTGALQSTFLFLANQPVPSDRRYAPYMRSSPGEHSNVGDLALAYSISKEGDLLNVGSFGQFGGIIRGSVAKFSPLRVTLAGLLSEQTLQQVGAAYDPDPQNGRRLLVGVADVNDGNGYAIDLTELANRLVKGTQDFPTVQACYIDALIASSSVPLAVPPVTLDVRVSPESNETGQHMYIDGGARFGVFWTQLGAIYAAGADPEFTLIVNGRLFGKAWVEKNGKPRNSWSSVILGLRAIDILENQVYRFSVDNVQRLGDGNGRVKMAFISNQGLSSGWGNPDDFRYDGKSCAEWSNFDSKMKPNEFHAKYMRCLLEYGRERGKAMAWNKPEQ